MGCPFFTDFLSFSIAFGVENSYNSKASLASQGQEHKEKVLHSMLKKYLIVFLVSMVPLIELRGGVPIAVGMDLNYWLSLLVCIIGNMLPVPFIYFFARKVLLWGKDKKYIGRFFTFCLEKGEKGGRKLKARAGRGGLFIALLLFVGIPLPGTGAWTGTLAASFLNMGIKSTSLAVSLGVLLAGIIMGVASSLGLHFLGL